MGEGFYTTTVNIRADLRCIWDFKSLVNKYNPTMKRSIFYYFYLFCNTDCKRGSYNLLIKTLSNHALPFAAKWSYLS